ncbi:MAG: rhamnogalacturonan lyase [Prevotellaceae bacterium]|nr:rhamnogalacturonan lyase [Prevotellaceae bacterium]
MKKILSLALAFSLGCAFAAERQMERLDRGVVAVKTDSGVFVSWRLLGSEPQQTAFNLYRNGAQLNSSPLSGATCWRDLAGGAADAYTVSVVNNGKEQAASKPVKAWDKPYLTMQLNRPTLDSVVVKQEQLAQEQRMLAFERMRDSMRRADPESFARDSIRMAERRGNRPPRSGQGMGGGQPVIGYAPNDCSVADLDGDGEYELVVKWDARARDNSQAGITDPVIIDAYKLDGTQLWRIDLGRNIRAGAHYTQMMVYDFDGDGKAELVCKTAPGTIDGTGKPVLLGNDDPTADYRNAAGHVLSGPEYLTVFDGRTGANIHTIPYNPPRGNTLRETWGDANGNRSDRYLACVAYLDGQHPSVVMCRGYYTRAVLAAYDFDGKTLKERWVYDSGTLPDKKNTAYGQGNHSLAAGDVDGDGCDEITYGGACINNDGRLLYSTGLGHGDAHHLSDLDPDRPGLEFFDVHETKPSPAGVELRDAKTGELIFGRPTNVDVGRGLAADIDPNHRGFEFWSSASDTVYNIKGQAISLHKPSVNFRIYWDGDLQDELLDGTRIDKWNGDGTTRIVNFADHGAHAINGTKNNPCLSADLFGDWREEAVYYNDSNPSQLMIFTTTIPTTHRMTTLMHDPHYRLGVAAENTAYNQPPHLGKYIGK